MTDTETLIERLHAADTDPRMVRLQHLALIREAAAALAAEKERADDAEKRQMRSGAAAKDNWDAAFIARQRAEAAEAQVAALRKALERIVRIEAYPHALRCAKIAREALL